MAFGVPVGSTTRTGSSASRANWSASNCREAGIDIDLAVVHLRQDPVRVALQRREPATLVDWHLTDATRGPMTRANHSTVQSARLGSSDLPRLHETGPRQRVTADLDMAMTTGYPRRWRDLRDPLP
jgi:hypothetical protein